MPNIKYPIAIARASSYQMSNQNKYDIHERIFNFVVNVLALIDKIPKTPSNIVIINQITRSVTSMGANDQEADGALTKKDFIYCFIVVKKEGKETVFWLRLLQVRNPKLEKETEALIMEGKEIVAIISSIVIKTTKNNS